MVGSDSDGTSGQHSGGKRSLLTLGRPREGESIEEFSKRFADSMAEALKNPGEAGADRVELRDEGAQP